MCKDDSDIDNVDIAIKYIIRKHFPFKSLDYQELFQIGYLGYLKAKKNYNPDMGPMSFKYAQYYIRNEIGRELMKRNKVINNEVQVDFNDWKWQTAYSAEEPDIDDDKVLQAIKKNKVKLSVRELEAIKNSYLNDEVSTDGALAKKWKVSSPRVHFIRTRALKKIKAYFNEEDKND